MGKNKSILIVDDEEDICEILQYNLKSEGYSVDVSFSAEDALEKLKKESFSLILLDVMMEGMSGFKMAEILRDELHDSTPVIFLTAKDTENDMLTGFSVGGDDYISKPFSIKELIARVKAVLRRSDIAAENMSQTNGNSEQDTEEIRIDELLIQKPSKMVYMKGIPVQLTKKEFEILLMLASSPLHIFSREEILKQVWTDEVYVLERTVDVHITRLRKKLGEYGRRIINRSNYGYMFE